MAKVEKKYKYAVIASDVAIFTVKDGELKVLLIEMKKKPFSGMWALPGGLVEVKESVDRAAERQLLVKTGVKNVYLEQLYTFGEVNRDPFGRVVSVAYFALIPGDNIKLKTTKEYADVKWYNISDLPKLAYDHRKIIDVAYHRLQSKLGYTNIVYSLMPREFSLTELQETYEIIKGTNLDKRNFRKKVLSLDLIKKVDKMARGSAHRPASLYSFKNRKYKVIQML
jgi:8-oxo-dGTP diphosphatase